VRNTPGGEAHQMSARGTLMPTAKPTYDRMFESDHDSMCRTNNSAK